MQLDEEDNLPMMGSKKKNIKISSDATENTNNSFEDDQNVVYECILDSSGDEDEIDDTNLNNGNQSYGEYNNEVFNTSDESLMNSKTTPNSKTIAIRKQPSSSSRGEFVCTLCDRRYKSQSSLSQHMNCHYERYKCSHCNKAFPSNTTLLRHLTTHTMRKEFECSRCPKTFNDRSNWKRHEKWHDKANPQMCPGCNKAIKSQKTFEKHKKSCVEYQGLLDVEG